MGDSRLSLIADNTSGFKVESVVIQLILPIIVPLCICRERGEKNIRISAIDFAEHLNARQSLRIDIYRLLLFLLL